MPREYHTLEYEDRRRCNKLKDCAQKWDDPEPESVTALEKFLGDFVAGAQAGQK